MSQYYVYAYLNPLEEGSYNSSVVSFSAKPFYIGKGVGGRLFDHLKDARPTRKHKNSHKLNTISYGRLYKPSGKRIIFEGELKGKYRNDNDISINSDKKYQYGLVWNLTKSTFLNHKQI